VHRLISTIRTMIVVRNRSFGLIWTSQLLSGVGTWLLEVAVPVYVFRLTGSTTDTGLTVVAGVLPLLLAGPVAGVFADRWPRRRTMVGADLLRACCVGLLLLARNRGELWLILLAVFAENLFGAFFNPAYSGLVPSVVGRGRDLEAANSWFAVSSGIVRLTGAPLGGALYALAGFRLPVTMDAGSYLTSALLVALIRSPSAPAGQAESPALRPASRRAGEALRVVAADLRAGLAALAADQVLTVLLTASALFLLGNGALSALLVPYVIASLHAQPASVGELFTALGAGYLLSAYLGRRACASGQLRASVVGLLALLALAFAGLFNVHVFAFALVFIGVAGLGGGAFLMFQQTMMQRRAPDSLIGRISSAYSAVLMAATLLGALLASVAVAWVGRGTALNMAIAVIACGAVAAAWLPARASRTVPDPGHQGPDLPGPCEPMPAGS
jgi:MFS family permease